MEFARAGADNRGMLRLFHVLRSARSRRNWLFRTDGMEDVVLPGEQLALDYARTVCQRLADRWGEPVKLRKWNAFERFTDETFSPSVPTNLESLPRRRSA